MMLEQIEKIAREAGEETLRFYSEDAEVELKDDDSPLTKADLAAHRLICSRLRRARSE